MSLHIQHATHQCCLHDSQICTKMHLNRVLAIIHISMITHRAWRRGGISTLLYLRGGGGGEGGGAFVVKRASYGSCRRGLSNFVWHRTVADLHPLSSLQIIDVLL